MDFYFKVMRGKAVGADSIRRNWICRLFFYRNIRVGDDDFMVLELR